MEAKYTNTQIHKYTNTKIHKLQQEMAQYIQITQMVAKYTNTQIHKLQQVMAQYTQITHGAHSTMIVFPNPKRAERKYLLLMGEYRLKSAFSGQF